MKKFSLFFLAALLAGGFYYYKNHPEIREKIQHPDMQKTKKGEAAEHSDPLDKAIDHATGRSAIKMQNYAKEKIDQAIDIKTQQIEKALSDNP